MSLNLALISPGYFKDYSKSLKVDVTKAIKKLTAKKAFSAKDFEHYIIASSVFSSKIEGNTLDLNSFMRLRDGKPASQKKEVKEIEDLVDSYRFASDQELTFTNFLKAHRILSRTLLSKESERGKLRKMQVGVYDGKTGKPVYLAVEPEHLKKEIIALFKDIDHVLNLKLNVQEKFYYSSMAHLWLAMLHPFTDGNGRAARLLEKWLLASIIGKAAWSINSEKYYWDNRLDYYKNISLGYNYYALKWSRCIPFLHMLPKALE